MLDKKDIAQFEIFEDLSSEEIDSIIDICQEVSFKSNEVILEESNFGSCFYILLKGRVNVELKLSQFHHSIKNSKHLSVLRKGDVFGEISFLGEKRRSARVIAIDNIDTIKIDKQALYNLFEKNNHIGYLVMKKLATILSKRLVDVNFMWRNNI